MTAPQRLEGTVVRRVSHQPWWRGIARAAEGVVRSIPSHRDSRAGRRSAAQIRAGFLLVGVLTVVFWESGFAVLGFVLLALAFFVPINEARRRGIVASLRAARAGQTREQRAPGVLEIEESHVTLWAGEERVRRLRRNGLDIERGEGRLDLRNGKKKVDHVVLSTAPLGDKSLDLWFEVPALPLLES